MIRLASVFLLFALSLSGCSSFSRSGRQQHAYEKYVRRTSMGRVKQQRRFHSDKPQMPTTPMEPSAPIESSETGPQGVPSDG